MNTSLDAAAADRKAHLASLRSKFLKRKAPASDEQDEHDEANSPRERTDDDKTEEAPDVTKLYLSGRNYDIETKGPKLGFDVAPNENVDTLEDRTETIIAETKAAQQKEATEDKPLDLFSLQPKKPNWDLKRDLEKRMKVLNSRTDNAIAKLVRERINGTKLKEQKEQNGNAGGESEATGIEGNSLVEGVHLREQEAADEDEEADEDDA
jgi:coiled-coil domain-containing protein 12